MWSVWFNRIGIILDLLAGFMVAPELIGLDRIGRFEDWAESRVDRLSKLIAAEMRVSEPLTAQLLLLLFGVALGVVGWLTLTHLSTKTQVYLLAIGVGSSLSIYILSRFDPHRDREWVSYKDVTLGGFFIACFTLLLAIPAIIVSYLFLGWALALVPILGYFIPIAALYFLNRLRDQLMGDEKLRGLLVAWGVAFFIVGNLLQLISTFISPE